jgi:hypothetical protein
MALWLWFSAMYRCHICGCELAEPPWGDTGTDPTWNICSCCGCEFGYHDCQLSGVLRHRHKWLATGGQWSDPEQRPPGWSLEDQLRFLPSELPAGIRRDV